MNKPLIREDTFQKFYMIHVGWKYRSTVLNIGRLYEDRSFEYAFGTEEFDFAIDAGFQGLPPYPLRDQTYETSYLIPSRVMSKKRPDYKSYLDSWRIDENLELMTPFHQLGLTEGRIPNDPFVFVPCWEYLDYTKKLTFLTHIRGTPYEDISCEDIKVDDSLTMYLEPLTRGFYFKDKSGQHLGYINSLLQDKFNEWSAVENISISASIGKMSGHPDTPRLYVAVEVAPFFPVGEDGCLAHSCSTR